MDLNARTESQQCATFKVGEDRGMMSVEPSKIGIRRISKDGGVDATNLAIIYTKLVVGIRWSHIMVCKGGPT